MVIPCASQATDTLCSWWGLNARVYLFSDDCCTLNLRYFLCIVPQRKSASCKLFITACLLAWWWVGVESVLCCSDEASILHSYCISGSWGGGLLRDPAHPSVILSSPESIVLNPAYNLASFPGFEIFFPVFFPQLQWDCTNILKMMVFVAPLPKKRCCSAGKIQENLGKFSCSSHSSFCFLPQCCQQGILSLEFVNILYDWLMWFMEKKLPTGWRSLPPFLHPQGASFTFTSAHSASLHQFSSHLSWTLFTSV